MAQYEDSRIKYRQAVLASLNAAPGAAPGEAIKEAIDAFQLARAELARHGYPPPPPPKPVAESLRRKLVRFLRAS